MNTSDHADSAIPKLPLAAPPSASPSPRPRKTRGRWRWSTIFGVLVLVLLVTLAAGWIGFGVWARHRLNTQLAAIRDAGEPMTWRELSGPVTTTEAGREYIAAFQRMVEIDEFMRIELLGYKIGPGSDDFEGYDIEEYMDSWAPVDEGDTAAEPEDENWQLIDPSTGEYRVIEFIDPAHTLNFEVDRDQMDAFPDSPFHSMLRRFGDDRDGERRIKPHEVTAAADWVRAYASALERLDRTARMEPCEIDFGVGPWDVRELGLARGAANLLLLRGLVSIHNGDLDAGVDAAIGMMRMRRLFQRQRSLIGHLVDRSIESLALALVSETLTFGLPSESKVRELHIVMQELYEPDQLTRGVMADRIESHEMIDEARRPGGSLTGDPFVENLPGPLMIYFHSQYLEDVAKLVAGSRKPFPEILVAMRLEPTGMVSGIFLYRTDRPPVIDGRFLVTLRSVEAAIAIERYRRDHGSQPENLGELVPEYLTQVPIDPFNDQPLNYKVKDDGYLIYSVDMNRMDDGGDMKIQGEEPPDFGITIRHRAPR